MTMYRYRAARLPVYCLSLWKVVESTALYHAVRLLICGNYWSAESCFVIGPVP